jgi:hypothetical protein
MKYFIPLLFLIGITVNAAAQSTERAEGGRLEALKVAFLTKKLPLTPAEAQRFWPVYNQYATEIRQARIDHRRNAITELEREDKILAIRKKYNTEFQTVLSAEKVNTFFRSEKEFGNYVRKELAERRQLRQQLNQHNEKK